MDLKMLHIQMYLRNHTILYKTTIEKMRYMRLLEYMLMKYENQDQWKNAVLDLYRSKLIADLPAYKEYQKRKLAKYYSMKAWLLTDCLFVVALLKKSKGHNILTDIKTFYKGSDFELEYLFKAFYSQRELAGFREKYPDMVNVYQIIRNNRKFIKKPEKRILFTGLMSSGKSTLLNALVGKQITKTQNAACTSKKHYLFNKASEDGFCYKLDGELILNAADSDLKLENATNKKYEIYKSASFFSPNKINQRICLIDTPGINSSENPDHKQIVENALRTKDFDLLVYIFNGKYMGTEDVYNSLKLIRRAYNGKIVFLLNQVDKFEEGVDSIEETLSKVYKDLIQLGFMNANIFPISAKAGFLIKQKLLGLKLDVNTQEELDSLIKRLKKSKFHLNKYFNNIVPITFDAYKNEAELYQALLHSGIISLEKLLY